jgi:hypothetical protein
MRLTVEWQELTAFVRITTMSLRFSRSNIPFTVAGHSFPHCQRLFPFDPKRGPKWKRGPLACTNRELSVDSNKFRKYDNRSAALEADPQSGS